MKPTLLLLNPPASRPIMRDYYCSSTSKAGYLWQPIDLICQSGRLDADFALRLIDAPATGWSAAQVLDAAEALRPAVALSLIGSANHPDDERFLGELHARLGVRVFVSGDLARFAPADFLAAHPWAEGVVTDFTASGLADHLRTGGAGGGLARRGESADAPARAHGEFAYPAPRHDLFAPLNYRMPFLGRPFASTLTNYGCPHRCRYCNSGEIGFAERNPDDLFAELESLRRRGVSELFIKDMTFNASPERAKTLLERWLREEQRFRWIGYFRAEQIDDELAGLLKRTRCAMAQLGVETANAPVLRALRATVDPARVQAGVRALARAGVPFGGHFIFGLPGDGAAGYEQSIAQARRMGLAYASFNVFTERPGAPAARGAAAFRRVDPSQPSTASDGGRLEAAQWVRRAYRRFYLRPGYVWTLARRLRSPRTVGAMATMAWSFWKHRGED